MVRDTPPDKDTREALIDKIEALRPINPEDAPKEAEMVNIAINQCIAVIRIHRPKVDEAAKTQAAPVCDGVGEQGEKPLHVITANGCSICGTEARHCSFFKTYQPTPSPTPRAELEKVREHVLSIANNTCCDRCQEAALVAKQALAILDKYLLTPTDK